MSSIIHLLYSTDHDPGSQAAAGLNDFSLIVGTPASNCGGGTANLIAVVGGQLSITDTWSQDLSAGLSLGNAAGDLILNISGTQTWQNSQVRRLIEVVNMTIPPERQVNCAIL
jgi:hypothetical protein